MHGQSLILPLVKCLTVDQIRTALVAFQENNEIKYSWGMSAILADLLRETRPSVEAVRAEWQEIYDSVCRENREESALPLCEMLEEVFPNLNSRADEVSARKSRAGRKEGEAGGRGRGRCQEGVS